MSKKLYSIDVDTLKSHVTLHKEVSNPTCVAIIKALLKMSKDEEFRGETGDNILRYAINHKMWSTRQDDDKLMTTWAYYVKKLKIHAGVKVVGEIDSEKTTVADLLSSLE